MQRRVWTAGRKWMGNLIPLLIMLPLALTGIITALQDQEITPLAIAFCASSLVVGWLAVNFFGFFGNSRLRREIQRKVLPKAGRDASSGTFVGFARPSYMGLLDAHEDLGYLFLADDALEYVGELHRVSIPRKDVSTVRYRPNIHSALGLGRWVSIEAVKEGKPIRVLVEPREAATLLGNKLRGAELRRKIEAWRRSGA